MAEKKEKAAPAATGKSNTALESVLSQIRKEFGELSILRLGDDAHEDIPAEKRKKINPFGVGRLDHRARHDEELARIPAQYKIDLELPSKEPDGF